MLTSIKKVYNLNLASLSTTHMLTKLAQSSLHQYLQLVWLNSNPSVIGLLPKWQFLVYPSSSSQPQLFCYQTLSRCTVTQTVTNLSEVIQQKCYQPTQTKQTCSHQQVTQILTQYIEQHHNLSPYTDNDTRKNNHTNTLAQPSYHHGLIGFISYDYAAEQLTPVKHAKQPSVYFGHYDIYLRQQHGQWQLVDYGQNDDLCVALIAWLKAQNGQPNQQQCSKSNKPPQALQLQPTWAKSHYHHAFTRVQHYLVAGDCYQINLTQKWQTSPQVPQPCQTQGLARLSHLIMPLNNLTQAPYAGYLQLNDFELLSCSPELFIRFYPNNLMLTKPIKGTLPRLSDSTQDAEQIAKLKASTKDTAENLMIVDLLRNDLGKYAQTGSVQVPKLFKIESFAHVHHMVSSVTAVNNDHHPIEVLFGTLPGGSITGAPKKRAVQIIAELEQQPRGAYCGSFGFLNFDGTGEFNILIRTLQANSDEVNLWAGGGITIASQCEAEYQECLDKVGAILDCVGKCNR